MNRLEYALYENTAHLVAAELFGGDELEVRADVDNAVLTVGKIHAKMPNGVGRVKFSALADGIYDATLIVGESAIHLGKLKISHGIIKLHNLEGTVAKLSKDLLDAMRALDYVSCELEKLRVAVYGKTIL